MLINPYKLPTASEDRLGGIKAAEKTTETVEVKIDTATGKLYVPGEENVIEEVKVNGVALIPDVNKSVDVTVPEAIPNIIEEIKVNGVALIPDANKSVNVTVPEATPNVIEGVKVGGTTLTPDGSKDVDITFLPTTTTEPTAAWTGGGHKIVILSSEPTTKYDGWIYLITST